MKTQRKVSGFDENDMKTYSRRRGLKLEEPLRLLLNLFFYHFNCSEPTYKSQRIKLPDVIEMCDQLNVNALSYSLSPGVWQSFVTIRSCNHLMRIISTYVDNTKKNEIS